MKKILLFSLCLAFVICFCACSAEEIFLHLADWMETKTVYETVISARYEIVKDAELFERRLDALGLDILATKNTPEYVEYTVLSHFPLEAETVRILSEQQNAAVVGRDGNVLLCQNDFFEVYCSAASVWIDVATDHFAEFRSQECTLTTDTSSRSLYVTCSKEEDHYSIYCSFEDFDLINMQKLGISLSAKPFAGTVETAIIKETTKVKKTMKERTHPYLICGVI